MTKEILIGLILAALGVICMSGCVVTTRRDFNLIMKANESIGYMRGLSDCAAEVRKLR